MTIVFLLLGIICLIYGFLVVSIIGTTNWFNFAFIIIGIASIILSIIWKKYKENRIVKRVISIILVLCILIVGVFEVKVISFANSDAQKNAEYIIVLGAKVKGENPSREFSERIQKAYEYALENKNTKIVLTGGKGSDEIIAESIAAKRKLISLGINEDRILLEDKSTSTEENLIFALDVISNDGGSKDSLICIISSSFHLYRTSIIAKRIGYSNLCFIGANGMFYLIPHYYLREFAAFVHDIIL